MRQNYTLGDRVEGPRKFVKGREGYDDFTERTFRYINKEKTGKGWESNGYFCTLRCGEAFGLAFAQMGRRLQPIKKDDQKDQNE